MVRLIIIDKNVLYRECLIAVLKSSNNFRVIGNFSGLNELGEIKSLKNSDLILFSSDNDVYTNVKTIHKLRRLLPKVPILAYGSNSNDRFRNQIAEQGVQSYIDTNHTPAEFIKLVKKTSEIKTGKSFNAKKGMNNNADSSKPPQKRIERLSNRELLVLKMIASGKTIKDISDDLTLKVSTVHTFRTRLMNKLKLKNNVEIALFAINNKIVNTLNLTG